MTLDHVVPRHRGGAHTWENLVTACKTVQPPQGRQDAGRGAPPPAPAAVRTAKRHLLAVHAVPRRRAQRGLADRTCSWVATDGPPAGPTPRSRPPLSPTCSLACGPRGHAAYLVGGSLRDISSDRHAGRLGPRDRAPGRIGSRRLFPGAVYENQFGTVAVREAGETFEITTFRTDHDYADIAARTTSSSAIDRGRPCPSRLHRERDGLGRRRRPGEVARARRSATAAADMRPRHAAGRRRSAAHGSRRTPCG